MDGLGKLLRVVVVLLFVFVVFGSLSSPAAVARPTVGFPGDAVQDADASKGARPCDMAAAVSVGKGAVVGSAPENKGRVKVAEKYASLLLNALPRGRVPPSGPSPQINDVKT